MIRTGRRSSASTAALVLSLVAVVAAPLRAADGEPPAVEGAPLVSIARTLERIERLLRLDQSSRLLELRFRRLELLRDEMAPLEGELRSYRSMDVWQEPEMKLQEERIAGLEEQIEAARLDGKVDEAEMLETNLREQRLQVQSSKDRLKTNLDQAEALEGELSGLRSERDRAVAEIDALLSRLEQEIRRDRQP